MIKKGHLISKFKKSMYIVLKYPAVRERSEDVLTSHTFGWL